MAHISEIELKRGQRIKARVEEVSQHNVLIVSFRGDLIRVENNSGLAAEVGDVLDLEVISLLPVQLRFYQDLKSKGRLERFA